MQIKYDKQANAKYIKIKTSKVHRTEPITDWLIFDYDRKGEVVGIEVLDQDHHYIDVHVLGNQLLHCASLMDGQLQEQGSNKEETSGEYELEYNEGVGVSDHMALA